MDFYFCTIFLYFSRLKFTSKKARTITLLNRKKGEMAEWSKAHAWKVCIPHKGIEGSNPSLSASKQIFLTIIKYLIFYP